MEDGLDVLSLELDDISYVNASHSTYRMFQYKCNSK